MDDLPLEPCSADVGCETRLADATVADNGHELAALLCLHSFPGLWADRRQLALAADEGHPVLTLRHVTHRQQPIGGNQFSAALGDSPLIDQMWVE